MTALSDVTNAKFVLVSPLIADASFEKLHPRGEGGRFGTKSPFNILPKAERGKSGDRMYAPGMWGRYGGAGIMMRYVGADGVPRYMVVQRATGKYNKWRWQLPGGAREELETAEQAAAREAFEEIGINEEQLATLTPRGAHVVQLPVEGKRPWTYSSIAADAPEAFRPKIDYGELGAARWLTYEQLVEMRGRGRLIAPFAAQLEDIIAKFNEPLVAGFIVTNVTTSDDYAGYYDIMIAARNWDESKVKRDSEGQFAKKASSLLTQAKAAVTGDVVAVGSGPTAGKRITKSGSGYYLQVQTAVGKWINATPKLNDDDISVYLGTGNWEAPAGVGAPSAAPTLKALATAKIKSGKPIHINTAVIYKKGGYADGTVVAERVSSFGTPSRLVWSEKKKKFQLQSKTIEGSWLVTAEYGKGAAYDKFSKETGWTKPGDVSPVTATPPATPKKAVVSAPKPSPSVKASKSQLGKPIHLNTTAIYKTKYDDGAVVAEKTTADDATQRIIWDAGKKKFSHQEFINAKWHELKAYTKGDAYKKFSKQTGWTEPTAPTAVPAVPSAQPIVVSPGDVDKFSKIGHPDAQVKWVKSLTLADLAKYDDDQLEKISSLSVDLLNSGYLTYDEAIAFDKIKGQAALPSIIPVPDFYNSTDAKITDFFKALTQDDYDSLSVSDQATIAYEAPFYDVFTPSGSQKFSEKIKDFDAGKGAPASLPDFSSQAATATWIENLTPATYDALTPEDKKKLLTEALKLPDPDNSVDDKMTYLIGNFVGAKASGAAEPMPITFDWDDNSGPEHMSPVFYEGSVPVAYAKSAPDGYAAYLYAVDPTTGGKGLYVGYADFDANQTVEEVVAELIKTGTLKTPGNVTNVSPGTSTLTPGSTTKLTTTFNIDTFLNADEHDQSDVIPQLTDADVDALSSAQYAELAAQTVKLKKKYLISQAQFDAFNLLGTKGGRPTVAPPPSTHAPDASAYHIDVHSQITPLAAIGVPQVGSKPNYAVLSPTQVASVQSSMLKAAGKGWDKKQLDAIKRYGTSVGYRSTNAVLRDDKKQQKLFSDAQLKDGVKNAVDLQNAMTPLTQHVQLFRGTGAQQFGQDTIAADFTKLKALEGKKLTDKGFISTTVDEHKTVSYDYAKKPIQVIINAPAGTPAVYADAAIPGHGEHEVILGAGTSYRVDHVRVATAADHAKYGSHVQHVVEVTVEPTTADSSTSLGAPAAKPAPVVVPTSLTPAAPSAATKPFIGHISVGDLKKPMKINTMTVYKQTYQNGAVVAYHKNSDGSLSRLAWNANAKKFVSQNQNADGSWTTFAGYGKGETYQKFGKGPQSADWFAPPPGDSALGSGGPFGFKAAPTISPSAPVPSAITAPPTPSAPQKFDAAELQKLHGQVPATVSATKRRELFDYFKKKTTVDLVTLSTTEDNIFQALHETLTENNNLAKINSLVQPLNMLQLLKIIDDESTNKVNAINATSGKPSVTNAQLYEKKLVAWLQTSAGASAATGILHPAPPSLINGHTYKSKFSPAVINTLKKIKPASSIGTPDLSATTFKTLLPTQAQQMQIDMAAGEPWTAAQKAALRKYTGSYYMTLNPFLRDIASSTNHMTENDQLIAARDAVNIQAGMRPLPQSVRVFRKTGSSQFPGLTGTASLDDIKTLEGQLFTDRGVFSTSIAEGTWAGKVHMTIDVPAGTPAAYVENISQNSEELEMLLAQGLKYRIVKVSKGTYSGDINVYIRVEG